MADSGRFGSKGGLYTGPGVSLYFEPPLNRFSDPNFAEEGRYLLLRSAGSGWICLSVCYIYGTGRRLPGVVGVLGADVEGVAGRPLLHIPLRRFVELELVGHLIDGCWACLAYLTREYPGTDFLQAASTDKLFLAHLAWNDRSQR